ncbi:MAG: phage tail assembly protein, partial [Rhizobiales bacterium]|nr:phage tail assembly protein [Hyphomicrobiales bacterium]
MSAAPSARDQQEPEKTIMEKITSVTVPLEYPVPYNGTEVKELTFRRMKGKDTLVAEGVESQVRAGYMIFAALAGVD